MREIDVRGRAVFITGANTGIGRAAALDLARRGAKIFAACRDATKGKAAVETIRSESGNADVELIDLDLGSLASVRRGAEGFVARGLPLAILIANAGVAGQNGVTADGFELHFGTNHLGHYLLT